MCGRYINDVNGHQEYSDDKIYVDHKHCYHDSSKPELLVVFDASAL